MSQFHPTQHAGDGDFQMWQQQMMYKQLQEIQRQQQQLQQPDHGARMQPSFGQFHAPAKPLSEDQFSTMSNQMLNNEATSSAWPPNFVNRDPSLTSNSPMLNNGSTNWDQLVGSSGMGNFINGSMFTNAQNQSVRPMGLATHQMDPSFYPMHGASSRGPGNQYSQFLGVPADSQSAMARVGPDQSEKTSRPFNSSMNEHSLHMQGTSMQNFGKGGFLNNNAMQSQSDNIKAGNPVTMNHLQLGFQAQDFHGRPNQVDFQVGVQEKPSVQVGPASGRASLDPTEEKILFGNDEDSNWGALLRGDDDHGNSLDNDNLGGAGAYSSLQSGSWSALMQEALQSTTSEKNSPKEQWSGLSFQKNEQVVANNSTISGRDENKLAALSGTNIENARPSTVSSYGDGTMNNPNLASFQHAMRTSYERRDQMPHESPSATVNSHQSPSEVNNGYFQQSLKQNQSDRRQEQVHLANGLWAQQKSELLRNNSHSTSTHATPASAHGFWMSQQSPANHNMNRETSNNQNDWKTNNALGQDINNTPNVFNSSENSWRSSGGTANSVQRLQQMKSDISTAQMSNESSDGKNMNMVGSSMPMVTQDHYQMITGRSGEQAGMNRNMGHRVSETSESPGNSTDQRSSDCNQEYLNANSNERQAHLFNHGQLTTSDSASRRHSPFAGKDSQNLGQSGQQAMGSYMLQNRAMGNSGMNFGHSPGNSVPNSLFPPQSHQMRNNLQHHFGTNSHVSSNTPSVNEKMLMAQEQLQSRHGLPNSSSAFGGSDAVLPQNRAVQNSQHMLQLLHKVDNSRNSNATADMANNTPGIVSGQQQPNQPTMQGYGLRLAPPSQRQSSSGHLWSSQTNADGKQSDNSGQEDERTQLPSTTSQSMTPPHPNSQSSLFHTSETDNTGQPHGRFPQLSSGQQYPAAEARPGPASMQQQPQQGSSATVFKNVWTNISAQRLAGMQANKITPNILQSMMFPNNAGASNLWSSQKTDDQGQKAATPPDVTTSSANSQSQDTKQAVDSDSGLAPSQKANFESTAATVSGGNGSVQKPSSDGNYANPVSSFAQLRQQGIMSAKQGENPGANFQAMSASHNTAHNGIVLHGSPAPSNIQQQNYSLLHQVQAMRHADIDPGNAVGKTINPEIGSDASSVDWKSGQRFAHVSTNSTKLSTDNMGSPGVPGSFPSDMKMLSFASRSEERNPSIPSQLPSGERQSHVMVTSQNDHQNQAQPIGMNAASNSVERSERPRINPQMAPSWFGHYGNYRNGQNLAMINAQKTTPLPYNFPKASWNIDNNSAEQRVESGQPVRPGHYPPSTKVDNLVSSNVKAASIVRPKKRKSMESALVPWHKIIEGPQKMRNISTSEMDWAWAANRLMEKDEAETLDDGPLSYLPRKRLILSTQLIQQLLPAIPATILRAQAVSAYESATYTLSMLTLRDACSMASSSLYNSCSPVDDENNPSKQTTSVKKMEGKLSKAVEVFVGRIRKMENDFMSLNKRASMLDVQLECQDLERISIVNRLGRFHGRNHAAAVEGSAGSEMIPRRIFPERHVMSFAVPGNLPDGAYCLSL
ncbi:hypothetical protein EJB05_07568 [Eragrostis curvula]|uniref:Uncharacterized protein n=1 Tax=Eragrostis curvula TaxID=38414 RepID=A0A5J9WKT7_9POAL|nr:hypothetical protein EJB05_07568 [Eragrostis curvula]